MITAIRYGVIGFGSLFLLGLVRMISNVAFAISSFMPESLAFVAAAVIVAIYIAVLVRGGTGFVNAFNKLVTSYERKIGDNTDEEIATNQGFNPIGETNTDINR